LQTETFDDICIHNLKAKTAFASRSFENMTSGYSTSRKVSEGARRRGMRLSGRSPGRLRVSQWRIQQGPNIATFPQGVTGVRAASKQQSQQESGRKGETGPRHSPNANKQPCNPPVVVEPRVTETYTQKESGLSQDTQGKNFSTGHQIYFPTFDIFFLSSRFSRAPRKRTMHTFHHTSCHVNFVVPDRVELVLGG
jgi:hypothetical protein